LLRHPELADLSIAHVDCDAFYASVEKRDNPKLAGRPVIVGGRERGVVAAACYMARIHGVRSAMPIVTARRLCPDAEIIKPDMQKYARVGREIRELMRALTPLVEPVSIDEAFLDLSGTERLHGSSAAGSLVDLALEVERVVGVSVSIGLSHNKFLAKLASDFDKPRGFFVIGRDEALAVLAPLPVSRIWGVGRSLQNRMAKDGIQRVDQLRTLTEAQLLRRYGQIGSRLYHLVRGEDRRHVSPGGVAKSVSSETTFGTDVTDIDELSRRMWLLSEEVSRRLKNKDLGGRTVHLKLRVPNFRTITRSRTLPQPTQMADRIFAVADAAMRECWPSFGAASGIRLAGVGVSGLTGAAESDQLDFADPDQGRKKDLARAIDQLRARHGQAAVVMGRAIRKS